MYNSQAEWSMCAVAPYALNILTLCMSHVPSRHVQQLLCDTQCLQSTWSLHRHKRAASMCTALRSLAAWLSCNMPL